MRIHYYKVSIKNDPMTVSDLLKFIGSRSQEDRERDVNGKAVFLERVAKRGGLYEMDFTQRRIQNGPGLSRRGKPTKDFELEEGDGFGEQTAALYSPMRFLAVQYNHFGVRPGGIRAYLDGFLPREAGEPASRPVFELVPVIDDGALARLQDSSKQTRLECTVHASAITSEMADHNVALQAALRLYGKTGGHTVQIAVSLGEGRRAGPLRVGGLIDGLMDAGERKLLTKCRVAVKNDLDTTTEVLDLLQHRETATAPDSELVSTSGHRYTYSSRVGAIRARFEKWLACRPTGPAGDAHG